VLQLLVTGNVVPSSPIRVSLDDGGDTFHRKFSSYIKHTGQDLKTEFFMVTVVKT
jgi:hypothetical protein